jgi:sugar O-acyltransferase (sialic acid O-acetyltransferase NeuD family)
MAMDDKRPILLYGASGHAKVVLDLVRAAGCWQVVALLDDNPALHGTAFCGVPIPGGHSALAPLLSTCVGGVVAIGNNAIRRRIADSLTANGLILVSACHPQACIAADVELGAGSVVMAGVVINPATRIGANCIINTRSSIDHDCCIGDHVHIAPGVTLCGGVTVGEGAFVGAGATVIPNVTIGANAMVGAGATVIAPVPPGTTVVGIPARPLKS